MIIALMQQSLLSLKSLQFTKVPTVQTPKMQKLLLINCTKFTMAMFSLMTFTIIWLRCIINGHGRNNISCFIVMAMQKQTRTASQIPSINDEIY